MSKHNIYLENTYPSGAQRWGCPTCGRAVIWQWPPAKMKNIVLIEGDSLATHSGFTGEQILQPQTDDLKDELVEISGDLKDQLNDLLGDIDF